MQLRQKLFIILSLMAILPLLFLFFEVVERVEQDIQERTAAELHKTLGKMAQELYLLMDNQKSLVRGLAKVPILHEFSALIGNTDDNELLESKATELMAFFLNYQSTVPSIQALRFTDTKGKTLVKVKEGRLIQSTEKAPFSATYIEDIAHKPFFKRAIETKRNISISDFERGKVDGEVDFCPAMVRYSVPIRDEFESLQGVLVVNMWGRRVDDAVEATLGGYPGKVYMAELNDDPDRDGIYLYHQDANQRFSNQLGTDYRLSKELGPATWSEIKQSQQRGMVRTEDGRMFFYRKFAPFLDRNTKWLLVIETAQDSILAPITSLRNWIGYLILAMLIASLLIARFFSTLLSKPVHDLAQIITRYADGEQSVSYIGNRSDEISVAGKAFNYLAKSLERAKLERDKAELAARQSERLAAVGQMAAGIGHEINNPLMNMMSLASLVRQTLPEDNQQSKDDLKVLLDEGRRCARIVQGIQNFARENEPSYEEFDFAKLVDDTLTLFNHRLEASNLVVQRNIESPLMMEGDLGQLQQVLVNIILNAIYVSAPGATIAISAQMQNGNLCFELLDNGAGIDEQNLPRIFTPFFTTKPEGSGTGLGLSVSYGIVKKHGGTISLENRDEGGVRVQIVLPLKSIEGLGVDGAERMTAEMKHAG